MILQMVMLCLLIMHLKPWRESLEIDESATITQDDLELI